VSQFTADDRACLFGSMSLWQGVDVPGRTNRLAIIDRLPFPRPDDPLMQARARDADQRGVNGFMAVSATHAALRLAQGAGRLIRSPAARGAVAVLDSRLRSARHAGLLVNSMQRRGPTTNAELVRTSLGGRGAGRVEGAKRRGAGAAPAPELREAAKDGDDEAHEVGVVAGDGFVVLILRLERLV